MTMITLYFYILVLLLITKKIMAQSESSSEGICPNNCNNKGTCGDYGLCTCFNNIAGTPAYRGYDCSLMICPFGIAWMTEEANQANDMRPMVECR